MLFRMHHQWRDSRGRRHRLVPDCFGKAVKLYCQLSHEFFFCKCGACGRAPLSLFPSQTTHCSPPFFPQQTLLG
jgi:hypothetical protein